MIPIPSDIMDKIKRLAEHPKAMAVITDVLMPLIDKTTAGLADINVETLPHVLSRNQGFIRGVDAVVRAFTNAQK